MKISMRRYDSRFSDPWYLGGLSKQAHDSVNAAALIAMGGKKLAHLSVEPDPRDSDGKKTVIIHGKRISDISPKWKWPHAELWGVTRCNVLYWRESLPDWDRWFDIHPVHPEAHHAGILAKRPEAWDWYTRQSGGRPIYLREAHPDVPDSAAFPREDVAAFLRPYFTEDEITQFTVSVDWMIPFALMLGFKRIVLNGIGTRFEPDFQYEHMGIWHWIGFARGHGVEVVIEGPSCPKWNQQMPVVTPA